jgi:hypothetical protein
LGAEQIESTEYRQLARGGLKSKPDAPENEAKYVRTECLAIGVFWPILAKLPTLRQLRYTG